MRRDDAHSSSTCPIARAGPASPDVDDGARWDDDRDVVVVVPPSADRRGRAGCVRRRDVLSLTAVVLFLCYQTAVVSCVVGASRCARCEVLGGGGSRQPAFLVSTVRDTLINTIIARQSLTKPSMSVQRKTPQRSRGTFDVDNTWSNAVRQKSDLSESRFGVRKRVRTVLDKAKKRTGVDNRTDERRSNDESPFVQTDLNVMVDAASVGGLGGIVFDGEGGSVDDALEYISRGMGDIRPEKRSDDAAASLTTIALSSYDVDERYEDLANIAKLTEDVNGAPVANNSAILTGAAITSALTDLAATSTADSTLLREGDAKANDDARERVIPKPNAETIDVPPPSPSLPLEPLPFVLPKLNADQSRRVVDGERVQYQDDMGLAGSGFVVWDVKAPASVVWDCLLDFQSYPQTIPTVREVIMYTNTHLKEDYRAERPLDFEDGTAAICKHGVPSVTRAQFLLSKFRLKVAAVHKYRVHPKGDYMIFTLDPASTNMVLKYAKGIWYTQSNPDGKEGHTRVWLLCELRVSRLLPKWIVDYAAARAMPRATTWLKPQTEAAAMLWLKESAERRK
jgi:hypothetical protein